MKTQTGLGTVIASVIFLVFAAGFLGGGLFIRSQVTPDQGDVVVVGTVVDVRESSGSDGSTYRPIVEYRDPQTGQVFTSVGLIGTSSQPELGSTREVAFPPNAPADAKVVGQVWFAWIFITIGVATLGILALVPIVRMRRAGRHESRPEARSDSLRPPQDAIYRGPQDAISGGPQDAIPSLIQDGQPLSAGRFGGPRRL